MFDGVVFKTTKETVNHMLVEIHCIDTIVKLSLNFQKFSRFNVSLEYYTPLNFKILMFLKCYI